MTKAVIASVIVLISGCASSDVMMGDDATWPADASVSDAQAVVDASAASDFAIPEVMDFAVPPDYTVIAPDGTIEYDLAATGDFAGEQFPAPHPPMPKVVNNGGRRLLMPRLTSVTFAGDRLGAAVDSFVMAVPGSGWWTATMAEYGVGPGVAMPPVHVNAAAPKRLDDADIRAWLIDKLDGTHPEFGAPDANSLYLIHYPYGTTVTTGGGGQVGCTNFAAYHSSIPIKGGQNISYAVSPRCEFGGGTAALDSVTGPVSHEIVEAATDADPGGAAAYRGLDPASTAWALATGAEVADMCFYVPNSFYRSGFFNYMVQRSWSNAAAAAGQDPCVPAPAQTYFNAAPVLTDTIYIDKNPMPGILAGAGQSATIELDLYSPGPTQPFTVDATIDLTASATSGAQLQFTFDNHTGANGSKLHMTVKVIKTGPNGWETFAITSTLGLETNLWMVAVSDQ